MENGEYVDDGPPHSGVPYFLLSLNFALLKLLSKT